MNTTAVHQIMTEKVQTCQPTSKLHDAAKIMVESDCGSVPVVDSGNHVVGMITDRDIALGAYRKKKTLQDIQVDEVMTKDLITCTRDEPIESLEQKMADAQVRRIPVVDDDNKLIGLVSLGQLARDKGVSESEVGSTLAKISKPS